ncbi:hypothetical protein VTI74DRAFT_10310 [Chaetomium olivicolor]
MRPELPKSTELMRQHQHRSHLPNSLRRWARAGSNGLWEDEVFDPEFWQKHLRPGNVWAEPRRDLGAGGEEVSPGTIPLARWR